MGLSRAHEPSAGLAEANGLPEAHDRPPKVHGLRGHCTPLPPPPLSVALGIAQPILKHEDRRLRCSGILGLSGRQ